MSLRAFHIVFVVVTIVLSLYVALWGIREFTEERSATALTLAVLFLAMAVGLMVYGKKAFAKLRDLPLAALFVAGGAILFAEPALACAVCYGAPGDPMVKGMNAGIWVLLGLVAFVQIGFVAMFWSFWRRGREQRRFRESLRVIEGGSHR
jgi:hypothetical protein